MKSNKKRLLCVLLAAILVCGMVSSLGTPVKAAGSQTYTKVTTPPTDWSGTYLIVYEDGTSATIFDGSSTTMNDKPNSVSGTITTTNGVNSITGDFSAHSFTIAPSATDGCYTIQSASGYYITSTSSSNRMTVSETYSTSYDHTISIDDDGYVSMSAPSSNVLKYNSSDTRFRYYASGQQSICLYKLEESAPAPTSITAGITVLYGNNLSLCFVPAQSQFDGYSIDSFWVEFTYTDPISGNSVTEEVALAEGSTVSSSLLSDRYVAVCSGQYAYQYTQDVTIALYYNGELVPLTSNTFSANVQADGTMKISINDYLNVAIGDTTKDQKDIAVATAAQAYCAAALDYYNG